MNNSLWHGNCSFVAPLLLLVVIAVDVIVVDVVAVVVLQLFYALRKKPLDRVMLSSALHRNLCPMSAGEWSSTHMCIFPTLLHSVQGIGEFLF